LNQYFGTIFSSEKIIPNEITLSGNGVAQWNHIIRSGLKIDVDNLPPTQGGSFRKAQGGVNGALMTEVGCYQSCLQTVATTDPLGGIGTGRPSFANNNGAEECLAWNWQILSSSSNTYPHNTPTGGGSSSALGNCTLIFYSNSAAVYGIQWNDAIANDYSSGYLVTAGVTFDELFCPLELSTHFCLGQTVSQQTSPQTVLQAMGGGITCPNVPGSQQFTLSIQDTSIWDRFSRKPTPVNGLPAPNASFSMPAEGWKGMCFDTTTGGSNFQSPTEVYTSCCCLKDRDASGIVNFPDLV